MKFKNVRQWSTEKISQRVFYCLLALAALVFALFFLVGYDMPFEENPDFNAPLFTNVLLFLMWALFILAFCLAVYSIVNSYRKNASKEKMVHGIPAKKIFHITWIGTLVLLIVTFLLGSSSPMQINGNKYGDWLWLKLSDMFVFTSLLMLLGAIVAVLFGATRYVRKGKNVKK